MKIVVEVADCNIFSDAIQCQIHHFILMSVGMFTLCTTIYELMANQINSRTAELKDEDQG